MGDVYQRSGRGGAGNFYSQKDIAEATKTAEKNKDLEAQKDTSVPADSTTTAAPPQTGAPPSVPASGMARTGRGGAGNFVDPSTTATASSTTSPRSSTSAPPPPVPPKDVPPKDVPPKDNQGPVFSGRGGAGNWRGGDGGVGGMHQDPETGLFTGPNAEQERKRQEALDRNFLQDIKDQLPQEPPRTYHMHIRGKGRIPTEPEMQ